MYFDTIIIAMARICRRKTEVLLVVEKIILEIVFMVSVIINRYRNTSQFRGLNVENIEHMSELVGMSDTDCFDNLRLNREAFNRLCYLLRHMGGLVDGRYVTVGEQVALFLSVLSHHSKVRVVRFHFKRSGQTIHTYFHNVLRAVLKLHEVLLAKSSPVTDESTYPSWKHFKYVDRRPMESGNAEQLPKPLRNRTENGRRSWSVREEQVLSEAMKKIVLEGWKTENGFKVGYLNLLSTYMKQVFPNTDLKPEPHINSRITVWKRNYHSLFEILKNTGVGLDSTTKMIEATDEQWDAFMKVDPNARLMRSKSWHLYDDWCEIFDNSRATGEASVSHLRATTPPPLFSTGMNVDSASNRVGDETQDESQSPSGYAQTGESTDTGKTNSGRKRKSPLQPDPMVYIVQNFCDNASNRLGDIAQRIGHDQDLSAARKMIYSSISKMSMLTLNEKLCATALIARNA
ncbi:hypothetical protein ACS0TY_028821 [Phlomoides rotata]